MKALRHETPDVATTAERLKLDAKASDTVANVIKTYHPPNAGKLSLVRVWSGQVTEGMSLNGVRVAGVLRLLGAQSTKSDMRPAPGEVVALARWKASPPARCCRAARRRRASPKLADADAGLRPRDRGARSATTT